MNSIIRTLDDYETRRANIDIRLIEAQNGEYTHEAEGWPRPCCFQRESTFPMDHIFKSSFQLLDTIFYMGDHKNIGQKNNNQNRRDVMGILMDDVMGVEDHNKYLSQ
jgi:hypothetical protein